MEVEEIDQRTEVEGEGDEPRPEQIDAKDAVEEGDDGLVQGKLEGEDVVRAGPADAGVEEVDAALVEGEGIVSGVALAPGMGVVDRAGQVGDAEGEPGQDDEKA